MRDLWPLLLILACPIMMIFMMRGMHGGHDATKTDGTAQSGEENGHPLYGVASGSEERIAQLEREVASLHALQELPPEARRTPGP